MKSTGFERVTAFILLAAGLVVAVIGLLTLFGWMLDIPVLTLWKTGVYPMAPITAMLFVLYGAALCLGIRRPHGRLGITLVTVIGVLGFITALLLLALRLQTVYLSAEQLGLRISGMFDNIPMGYIAPITAFCLLLSYGSLLVSLPYGAQRSWRSWLLFGFGGLISMVSFVILLAYIFGIPISLVSGKTVVPIALSTSFSLLIMGLAQLVLAARCFYRSKVSLDAPGVKPLYYSLVFLVLVAGIFAAAYYFYQETELKFHQAVKSQLITISELKTDELIQWRKERIWDGILSRNTAITTAVRQLLETPRNLSAQREIQDLLGKYQLNNKYDGAFLLDAKGVTLMSAPYKKESTAAVLVERATESLRMGQVMLQDFYRDEHDQRVYLALIVPVLDNQDGNRPLGVLVLRIDPAKYLYPHIQRWPAPSDTAEILLVRREGNDVLFLNDLRFMENTALTLRFPLKGNARMPAVKAVLGQRGIVNGLDYRGEQVIAVVCAIPDSPWYLVAHMDTSEVYAPLRERMQLTLLVVSVMVGCGGIVFILLWRQQKMAFYQKQFKLISKLQESHERFEFALQKMHAGALDINLNDNLTQRTREHDRIFGYESPLPKWTYGMFLEHVVPEDRPEVDRRFRESIEKRSDWNFECRIIRNSDRQVRWIWAVGGHIYSGGGIERMAGIVQDITERKQGEEKLHLAASVFTHAREGIMITAADGTIIDVNDAFCDIAGYSRDEILGRNPRILKSGRQDKKFYANMWRDLIEQGYWHGEIWNRRKNGELYAVMPTISAVRDEQGNTGQYVALYTDITRFKEHEQKLERSAHFDLLTNLPNRVLLADRLHQGMAQARRRGQRLAVAFLDLDGFKTINDNYGHEAGDQLLIALAAHMKQALREGDTLARLGGDEFVAVLVDSGDVEASKPILTRLLTAAAEPVQLGGLTLQVSASLGVTFYPQAEDIDADQLLRQADQSMYQAKQAGKNRYHLFDAEQDGRVRSRYENLERIRDALDAGEFVLYYQPKVNMRTGTFIGAEALVRWQHPEKGVLLPDQFLPALEDHLLGIELGEWVIDTALLQMETWQAAGLTIPVSINIGARHLQQVDFVEHLRALFAAHPNIRPGDVELEILETSALENLFKVSRVIDACRKMGVSFALDDFGTGYSSLSYLKHLPVTQLKIDQSFVTDMIDNPDDLSIVEGVIGLGTAFRLVVIAEGVETIEHSTVLLQLGCDLAQGYGIAHPMPAHQLPGWEATWRPPPIWSASPAFNRGDLPLILANIEHRAWIIAMEKYLKDERETPLPLDIHQCRFGHWLSTDGLACFGTQPNFKVIELLHWQVHTLASELYKLHAQGHKQEALARLGELHDLRDCLLEQLMLAQQSQP
ncbi:MAG: EAL domain-containing protein [Methylococcales bacterium]|nr:EAL domain-containing protein [Methylococcales bacterium]